MKRVSAILGKILIAFGLLWPFPFGYIAEYLCHFMYIVLIELHNVGLINNDTVLYCMNYGPFGTATYSNYGTTHRALDGFSYGYWPPMLYVIGLGFLLLLFSNFHTKNAESTHSVSVKDTVIYKALRIWGLGVLILLGIYLFVGGIQLFCHPELLGYVINTFGIIVTISFFLIFATKHYHNKKSKCKNAVQNPTVDSATPIRDFSNLSAELSTIPIRQFKQQNKTNESELTVIKNQSIVLRRGERADSIIFADRIEGDIFFSIRLSDFLTDGNKSKILLHIINNHHANIEVGAHSTGETATTSAIEIGTFENKYPLFVRFIVSRQSAKTDEYKVVVTFLYRA